MSSTRIGFLFNHDALHQVAHSAPLIAALKDGYPEFDISILASSDEQMALIDQTVPRAVSQELPHYLLRLPPALERIDRLVRHLGPFRRVAILRSNLELLGSFDALVVPELTTSWLKTRFGLTRLKLIFTNHGNGDRRGNVEYSPALLANDLVLVAGSKVADRIHEAGLFKGTLAVVGYPKFDSVATRERKTAPFFPNNRPTVLYNPHFEPGQSSWYRMGFQVLDYFAAHPEYNLVFAPHVMLFRRRVHTSLKTGNVGFRRSLPERYRRCSNIRIDLGGPNCLDMTYTLGADIYLGDVSSQLYEFMLEPRPCIFLNGYGVKWENNPYYMNWNCGPVLENVAELDRVLPSAESDHAAYAPVQKKFFAESFDLTEVPSARRAADAIANFLSSVAAPSGR